MGEQVLSGVRVLEIGGGPAAAFATRWLAGFGADVVRTEAEAEAEPARLTPDEEVYLLSGKLRVDVDAADLRELALAADILVEDSRPGALARRGIAPADLRAAKPEMVVVSISPFGQTGPYAGFEATNLTAFAMGGLMSLTGSPHREPLVNGGSQALYLGGLNGAGAALTAYFGTLMQGEGDWVDISLQECQAGMTELYGPRSAYEGSGPHIRSGNHVRAAWGIYPCADGFAGVCALERQIPGLFAAVGDPDLAHVRFADPLQRPDHDDELQARLYAWFATKTKDEILALSPRYKVPFGAVLTPGDLLANESLAERHFFDTVQTPGGAARVPGRPFLGFEWRAGELHDPGADSADVLRDWLGAVR